jgi:hypothetical protein
LASIPTVPSSTKFSVLPIFSPICKLPPLKRFATLVGKPRALLIYGGDANQPRTGTSVFA